MGLFSGYACAVCGKMVSKGLKISNVQTKKTLYWLHPQCAAELKVKANNAIPPYPQSVQEVQDIMSGKIQKKPIEYRKKCNVCGKVFCYTQTDLMKNVEKAQQAVRDSKHATMNAFFGTQIGTYANMQSAQHMMDQIKDYSKCPFCNSADLSSISEEEFKMISQRPAAPAPTPTPAPAPQKDKFEEIKKFKELLDMGIISQEEFDAKKKELLGM